MFSNLCMIEIYVEDLLKSKVFYQNALGFVCSENIFSQPRNKDEESCILILKNTVLILTSTKSSQGEIACHLRQYGDSVKNIFLFIDSIPQQLSLYDIRKNNLQIDNQIVETHSFNLCDDLDLIVIQKTIMSNIFKKYFGLKFSTSNTINGLDHIAICVREGNLKKISSFFIEVFGYHICHQETVDTGESAMNSIAVSPSNNNHLKLVFVEHSTKYQSSQIKQFIDYNQGAGVQHLAFSTSEIFYSVKKAIKFGVNFINVPKAYYSSIDRTLFKKIDFQKLSDHSVLIDRDDNGILLQTFTMPITSQRTLFIELISRCGATGFGSGNIKALFKAKERELSAA